MLIDNFRYNNENKENIAREKCETLRNDRGKSAEVSFYGHNFKVREPWYCGGSIETNCQTDALYGKDLDVITDFNVGDLRKFLSDLSYLKEFAEKRITDINRTENIVEIRVDRFKEGNKKLCKILVASHDLLIDGYSDSEIVNEHILEQFVLSDVLKTQSEIKEKVRELEAKYGVKCQ